MPRNKARAAAWRRQHRLTEAVCVGCGVRQATEYYKVNAAFWPLKLCVACATGLRALRDAALTAEQESNKEVQDV